MIDQSTLNGNQLEAVQWGEGSLLVLAGPGSGKTRVLTLRIARILESTPDKYFKILALTFTNKAAAEMRDRIAELAPNAGDRTLLTTFHSFAANLLRLHGHHIGLKPDFTILAQDEDRHALLEEAIDQARVGYLGQTSEKLLPLISRLTEMNISPEESLSVLQRRRFQNPEELASVYERYRSLMIERNTLDFSGLIAEALGLLECRPGVRKQMQRIYTYVCVDEFQDTNRSQYEILCHLVSAETKNLFVVADDDQIIYQWNGASPKRLWRLRDDFDMELLQLPENYRCPLGVVKIANKLIAQNLSYFAEKEVLIAHKKASKDQAVTVKKFAQFPEEADWVAKAIATRPPAERPKCVVLARTRKLLGPVRDALDKHGVAGYLAVRKNEFESASLQWLHSVLRLANSHGSREHLRRVCKAFFTLEGIDLRVKDIISHASAEDGDYLRSWAVAALGQEELSEPARCLIEESLIPVLSERLDFWRFQDAAFKWLDFLDTALGVEDVCAAGVRDERREVGGYQEKQEKGEYREEKGTWHQLVNEISAQHGKDEVTLHLLLQELDLRSKASPPPKDGVPCFTIHASKGMEFDHVYLVGMVEDQLPSWAAIKKGEESREMQEERRNCFVAITRAQETLTLTYSAYVDGWKKEPSRFLHEMVLLE